MEILTTPSFVPYTEWTVEAEKVSKEMLAQHGFTFSPDSIMRNASHYVTRVIANENGGIDGVMVWNGWQQAMRRQRYHQTRS